MIIRYSILGILRGKGKTMLFFLLITALVLLVNLGVMILVSTSDYLDECDKSYTTIGVVEYFGADYPQQQAYDTKMAELLMQNDFSALGHLPGVLLWEKTAKAIGSLDGYQRVDRAMPEKMTAVVIIGDISFIDSIGLYSGQIKSSIFSVQKKTNTAVFIEPEPYSLAPDQTYVAYGEYFYGKTGYTNFRILPFSSDIQKIVGESAIPVSPATKLENGKYQYDPAYDLLAEKLRVTSNSFVVNATSNILALLPFQQQKSLLTAGRAFTDDEYLEQKNVCIISELAAQRMTKRVGDTISLSIVAPDGSALLDSYKPNNGFALTENYTIIGICNETPNSSHDIYIPRTDQIAWDKSVAGFTIGQAVIANSQADEFFRQAVPLLPDGVLLTLYDQGYAAVTEPFSVIRQIASLVTAVCLAASLAVLVLFGFLFVYRQRETAAIMSHLGTSRLRIFGYFAVSTGLIALLAVSCGGFIATLLQGSISQMISRYAQTAMLTDLRFSDSNLSVTKLLDFNPQIQVRFPLFIGLSIAVIALISSQIFTFLTLCQQQQRPKKLRTPSFMRLSSGNMANPFKYAVHSIFRGGTRSVILPIVTLLVFMMFGQLYMTTTDFEHQFKDISAKTAIGGRFTDISGKQISNLVLEIDQLANLNQTGLISELNVAMDQPYSYLGITRTAGGEQFNIKPLPVPLSQFAFETLQAKFARGPRLIYTNSIQKSPEFYYAKNIYIEFLEGYDQNTLAQQYTGGLRMCLAPSSLMDDQGFSLGDVIRISLNERERGTSDFKTVDLLVVGRFVKQGSQENLYCQLGDRFDAAALPKNTFSSASFSIYDAGQLSKLKDELDRLGFSEVAQTRKNRTFVVLEDKKYFSTIRGLIQQIRYSRVLHTMIYGLTGLIGLIVAWLVTAGRRLEFAIMRGFGASGVRAILSFFIEQMALCLAGSSTGLVIWLLLHGQLWAGHIILASGFVACQAMGVLFAFTRMNRRSALRILTDEDN